MAIEHEDNDIPYRSPMDDVREDTDEVTADEEDASTLINVQRDINREVKRLSSIDVFTLKDEENGLTIKEQIAAYQRAKDILEPIQATINTAVDTIKQRQGGA